MAKNPGMNVGGVPLNTRKVNKPFLREMYKAAQVSDVAEGKKEALDAITELGKTGEMSSESLEDLDTFRKGVYGEYKADKKAFFDTLDENGWNFKDPRIGAIKKEMGINGAFLAKNETFATELREATARSAVQAIAGASFGPAAAIAGYAAYANGRTWDGSAQKATEALIETFKEYKTGESRMSTEGNKVEQVHRQELWPTLGRLTSEATEAGKAGKPMPIAAQYYELTSPEMIGNLATAAKAGSKLRLNLDAGRLSYPSQDSKTKAKYFEVDDIPHKMRTILQFASIRGADVGVSVYPANKELGDPTDLMHRKVLNVGEKVLMSGMNANMGSGENIDAGYVLEGPAAKVYTENVARDWASSAGATMDDIWGEKQLTMFKEEDLRMGRRGITALLDGITGPAPAGEGLPKTETLKDLESLAKKAKLNLQDLVDVPADKYESVMGGIAEGSGEVSLSAKGKEQLLGLMEKAIGATQTKKNVKALADVELPSGKKVGKTKVDIADLPTEREVLAINAINEAESFVYLPGFVVTRAVAGAIVAKQEAATAEGKPLDVRVIADSGIYPHGGTPNSWGVDFLEENNIPVRWSKLTRTGGHDRKIHAKQLLTDKGEIAGSTNFSTKGMRENWETSAYVHFEKGDKQAEQLKEQSKAQFEQLWDEGTYDLSTKDLAAYMSRYDPEVGKDWTILENRNRATKQIIKNIQEYEVATAGLVEGLLETPEVKERRDQLLAEGYSEGDSALMAADQTLGHKEFLKMRQDLPAHKELDKLKDQVTKWKAKYGGK